MEAHHPTKTARARPPTAGAPGKRTVGLTFLTNDPPQHLVPLPSFQDRLTATDTWNTRPWSSYNASASSSGSSGGTRAGSFSPTSTESVSSGPPAPRRNSRTSVQASTSSSTAGSSRSRNRKSQSPEVERAAAPILPAAARRALRRAQDEAVQRAVAEGTFKAESYTEGQIEAIKAQAASRFVRSHAADTAAPEEGSGSTSGIKRPRLGMDGHAAQVVNAVKTRRIGPGRRKRVVNAGMSTSSESGSGGDEERVEVEVDLRKLLGIRNKTSWSSRGM